MQSKFQGLAKFAFGGVSDSVEFEACLENGRGAMVRLARAEAFDSADIAIAHVYTRTVRRCFLMGDNTVSGKNFDHRKVWIENDHLVPAMIYSANCKTPTFSSSWLFCMSNTSSDNFMDGTICVPRRTKFAEPSK